MMVPGRSCPLDYRTHQGDLAGPARLSAETLYVAGGLYGNAFALDAIERMAGAEPHPVTIFFNGDAHWFDAEAEVFAALEQRLGAYPAIRGNVETELGRETPSGAGCGCAYPAGIDDDTVQRSNTIMTRLQSAAAAIPGAGVRLRALSPMLTAAVGELRIGIVHGDPSSIAGWGFALERLDDAAHRPWLEDTARAAMVDVFASTHTCGAVMRSFEMAGRRLVIANNGAAGMGNFQGDTRGLITRISVHQSPHAPLYGLERRGVFIDALPVPFDLEGFIAQFDRIWPEGSPAAISYRARICGRAPSLIAQAKP